MFFKIPQPDFAILLFCEESSDVERRSLERSNIFFRREEQHVSFFAGLSRRVRGGEDASGTEVRKEDYQGDVT